MTLRRFDVYSFHDAADRCWPQEKYHANGDYCLAKEALAEIERVTHLYSVVERVISKHEAEIDRLKKEAILLRDCVSESQVATGCSDKYFLGMWNAFEFVLSMQDRRAPVYKTERETVDFSQIKEDREVSDVRPNRRISCGS